MVTTAEAPGRKFPSPAYAALSACVPCASALVVHAATPAGNGTIPSTAVPSSSVTLPVGAPLVVLATVTLTVTGVPTLTFPLELIAVTTTGAFAMVTLAGATVST